MSEIFNYCLIGGCTDVGLVRKANEDRGGWFETPNGLVGVVCDGMGGHVGGQVASQTAIEAIRDCLEKRYFERPGDAIQNAIFAANGAILAKAQAQPELSGMGSTCVMLIVREGKVFYGHVGDSRLYIVINHIITQLTKDHSFVQMLVDEGKITKGQAESHPRKNEITNALGLANMQPPTIAANPIVPPAGACLVLCSDGLTGMVADRKIEKIVSNRAMPLEARAKELVKTACDNGGVDNVTVELVEFALGASDILPEPKKDRKLFKIAIYLGMVLAVVVVLAVVFYFWMGMGTPKEPARHAEVVRRQVECTGDTIPYDQGLVVSPKVGGIKESFRKDSCFVLQEYSGNIEWSGQQDNEIRMIWTNRDFSGDKIKVRIGTDSASYLVAFPVKVVKKELAGVDGKNRTEAAPPFDGKISLNKEPQLVNTGLLLLPFDKSSCKLLPPGDKYFKIVRADSSKITLQWNGKPLPSKMGSIEVRFKVSGIPRSIIITIDRDSPPNKANGTSLKKPGKEEAKEENSGKVFAKPDTASYNQDTTRKGEVKKRGNV